MMEENFFETGVFVQRTDAVLTATATIGLPRCNLKLWLEFDPIMRKNELGFISDTKEFVLGDGISKFKDLKRYKFVPVNEERAIDEV